MPNPESMSSSSGGSLMETPPAPSLPQTMRDARQFRLLYLLLALVTAATLAVFAIWVVSRGGSAVSLPSGPGPAAVSEAQLDKLASQADHPVYWAGAKSGAYELTRTTDGRIYVRYLPSNANVGDRSADYLTVGTYPEKAAFASLQRAAHRPGAVSAKLPENGLLVFNTSTPKSVYFGYPGANYQVEVYDASPEQARTLVLSGAVKPIR
jgi:hypothetical protein